MVSPIGFKGHERSSQAVDLDEILAEAIQETAKSVAACSSFGAYKKASAERTRWIKLAPLVNPDHWTNARLAELFDVPRLAVAETQKNARPKTEHAAYLLGQLLGMVDIHCQSTGDEGTAPQAAREILEGADITVQGIRDMFEGCRRAATRDRGAGQKARHKALDAWFSRVRRCPMNEEFDHDQLRAVLLGATLFWGLESEYGLRLEEDSKIMIRLGFQDEVSSWRPVNELSR